MTSIPAKGVLPRSLVLAGAGKMGGAMLEGWIAHGLPPGATAIVDPHVAPAMRAFCEALGIAVNPPAGAAPPPQALVLGIKPQMLEAAAPGIAPYMDGGTLLVSILAGKTIANLRAAFPAARAIVRAMPNLPASIGRGMTGAFASAETIDAERTMADALMASVGDVAWVGNEDLIDSVTAVSGSGPAYVFHLAECLTRAAEAAGLPSDLAARMARATVTGAGELLHRSDLSPAELRRNVTSPGGTTAAALEVLMAGDGLEKLMIKAVAAAKRRAGELSG